ncbi:MAG: hydroxymethylglutaryl-CoA reductase, degradative [Anaerolineae bacterium]|nr:hydroxymethylglutaryl-CoA reductase, degradative [Anaerolineae bacterium]
MSENQSSRLSGFYNLSQPARLAALKAWAALTDEEEAVLAGARGLTLERGEHMVENVAGLYTLPLGIATNFIVNGRETLVPMVIEEPSVIAGASLAAKLARAGGGFVADVDEPVMIGQLQVVDLVVPEAARVDVLRHREELLALANEVDPVLRRLGGGARDLEARVLESTPAGPMLVLHLAYDVRDAMGANAINTACERLAPRVEAITGGRVFLRILSNLADRRRARARVTIPETALAFGEFSGADVAAGIERAWAFAAADPYRAATHNKGIMNGIDAVVLATGNDWRASEAGAHAYAARSGHYTSLSAWRRDGQGQLVGSLELPLALGIVGGATRVHPTAQIALKILRVQTARELAEIVASVGLAQNLAAIRALSTEGIQRGHMSLHARQVAIAAGALGQEITAVADSLIRQGEIRSDRAEVILHELRGQR